MKLGLLYIFWVGSRSGAHLIPDVSADQVPAYLQGVLQEDVCSQGGQCGVGFLQVQQSRLRNDAQNATLGAAGLTMLPKVDGALVDNFLGNLKEDTLTASRAEVSCTLPKTEGFGDPEDVIKMHNYANPLSWEPLALCLNGAAQSPINFNSFTAVKTANRYPLSLNYKPLAGRTVINTGHNLEIKGEFGTLTLPDTRQYSALQFHIHAPSEHSVNGFLSFMELHMVHADLTDENDPRYAVLGIMFDLGLKPNPCIDQMLENIPPCGCQIEVTGMVDFMKCFGDQVQGPWYEYRGSFTTPPCTEGVVFSIMERRATITLAQYQKFKNLGFGNPQNNRPVQPVNGRIIYKHTPA